MTTTYQEQRDAEAQATIAACAAQLGQTVTFVSSHSACAYYVVRGTLVPDPKGQIPTGIVSWEDPATQVIAIVRSVGILSACYACIAAPYVTEDAPYIAWPGHQHEYPRWCEETQKTTTAD